MQFRPFFAIDDEGNFINLMSVGKVQVKKEEKQEGGDNFRPAITKTVWSVSMTAYPGGNAITLTGDRAEKFVEEYTNFPMGKSYL